jgi:hypothetical protein
LAASFIRHQVVLNRPTLAVPKSFGEVSPVPPLGWGMGGTVQTADANDGPT